MDGRQAVANREWLGVGVVWLGCFSKCVVLVVVVVRRCESGLFCFVSFRSHIRRKEAGPGWGLMVLFSCLFLCFCFCFFLLVRTCFTSSCCGFPPPLAPFRVLTFWCAYLHFDLIESGCSFCWIDTTCYVTPLHFYDRYITL